MSHKGRKIPVTDAGTSNPADDEERLADATTGGASKAGVPGEPGSDTPGAGAGPETSEANAPRGRPHGTGGDAAAEEQGDAPAAEEASEPRGLGGEAPPHEGRAEPIEGESGAAALPAEEPDETARAAQARVAELEAEIERLHGLLDAEQRRLQDVLLAYRRQKDELARHRERLEDDLRRRFEEERAKMLTELLDVADNLDRSIHATRQSGSIDALLDGLLGVHHQFMRVLERIGVEQVDPLGQPFDPHAHEAIAVVPVDDPTMHQHVVEVLRPGYRVGGRLLRPALVKVGQQGAT